MEPESESLPVPGEVSPGTSDQTMVKGEVFSAEGSASKRISYVPLVTLRGSDFASLLDGGEDMMETMALKRLWANS